MRAVEEDPSEKESRYLTAGIGTIRAEDRQGDESIDTYKSGFAKNSSEDGFSKPRIFQAMKVSFVNNRPRNYEIRWVRGTGVKSSEASSSVETSSCKEEGDERGMKASGRRDRCMIHRKPWILARGLCAAHRQPASNTPEPERHQKSSSAYITVLSLLWVAHRSANTTCAPSCRYVADDVNFFTLVLTCSAFDGRGECGKRGT